MQNRNIGPAWLNERLAQGKTILMDGATSTELERLGVPMDDGAWSGNAMLNHADVLKQVHMDYIHNGAEVIITNTFATSRQVLEPAGFGDQVELLNRLAVEIALQARDEAGQPEVVVAGSISTFRPRAETPEWLNERRIRATFREQAELLAEAGVDLLMMEMMKEPEIAVPVIEEALATGLPVWAGICCRSKPGQDELVMNHDPNRLVMETLAEVAKLDVAMIHIMHSGIDITGRAVTELQQVWDGPIGVYPNSGYFILPNWQFVDIISPDDFVREVEGWLGQGVHMIGGCCGIGQEHIARLKTYLDQRG